MKKISLVLITIFLVTTLRTFSQPINYVKAPNGTTSTQVRAPNGLSGYAYLRACALVLQSELTGISSPNSTITSFGFTLSAGTNTPSTGNFTVYLQNTSDITYNKGTTWSTILTGMTQVYASTMTLPGTINTTSITLTLSTPFVYTGGGIYVAYDWHSAGSPYATTPATYYAENTALNPGCASNYSSAGAPTTLGTTPFRPNYLFGVVNTYTNEISVSGLEAQGRITGMFNQAQPVKALVRNNSNTVRNNIAVSLNVSGANAFANTQTISSLASGATTTVTFATFTPTIGGLNTLSVSLPPDQFSSNNSLVYSQSVTCNEWALNPANVNYTIGAVGFNNGSGIIAVSYTNPLASNLSGIRVSISTPTVSTGNSVWAALLSSTGSIIATTNTVTITNGMLGTFQTFTFSTPVALSTSAAYYLGLAQSTGTAGYFPVGTYTSSYVPFTNYITTNIVGSTPSSLTSNLGYLGIEAIFTPTTPAASILSPTIVCGSAATLTPSTSASYTWASGPSNAAFVVTPTISSTYTLHLRSSFGCTGTNTVVVSVNPITINATGNATVCAGIPVTLGAFGASGYFWSTSQNTQTISVTPTVNTTYLVTGTNTAGCSNTAAVSISVNSKPVISISNYTVCSGNTITFSPSGANTYTFSSGAATLTPNTNTTISVVGTSSQGCISSNTAISSIIVNPTPTIIVPDGIICNGESFFINPTGTDSYSVSGGSFTVSPSTTTSYSVTGSSSLGCTAANTAIATVSVQPSLTVSISGSNVICNGENLNLSANGAATYTWSNGTQSNTILLSPTANSTYSVLGTSGVCSSSAIVSVTVNPLPVVTASISNPVICRGATTTVNASGADTYTWSGGISNGIPFSPANTTSYFVTGTYSLTGCTNTNVIAQTVTVNPLPNVSATGYTNIICLAESAYYTAGDTSLSHIWSTGSTNATTSFTPSVSGNHTLTLTGTDNNNCSSTFTFVQSVSECTELKELGSNAVLLKIYPNPNNGNFYISSDTSMQILLVNELGQVIKTISLNQSNNYKTSVTHLDNGIYIVMGKNNSRLTKQKIIVTK